MSDFHMGMNMKAEMNRKMNMDPTTPMGTSNNMSLYLKVTNFASGIAIINLLPIDQDWKRWPRKQTSQQLCSFHEERICCWPYFGHQNEPILW